jgi:hypothetical protein
MKRTAAAHSHGYFLNREGLVSTFHPDFRICSGFRCAVYKHISKHATALKDLAGEQKISPADAPRCSFTPLKSWKKPPFATFFRSHKMLT